jgi:Ca2+-binding RTX toxin-like protein
MSSPNLNNSDDLFFTSQPIEIGIDNLANIFITSTARNDRIVGTARSDRLLGLAGNDTLIGGAGNDFLAGNRGRDVLTGGAGTDGFAFTAPNEGIDRIVDFTLNTDFIGIAAADFRGGLTSNTFLANRRRSPALYLIR